MFEFIFIAGIGALLTQSVAFLVARRLNRVDVVDVAWGLSSVSIVLLIMTYRPTWELSVILVDILVLIWAFRLSWFIATRFKNSPQQDPRYTALIEHWPQKNYTVQLFTKIFLLQAMLATLVSLPVIVLHYYQPPINTIIFAGFVVWVCGFTCETIADTQLRKFLQTPNRPDLLQSGLWRYSRHPNYFGEITMWWGIAVMTFATPLWWLGAIGAFTITVLIMFVSGVPPAEARASNKKGWQKYKNATSILVPLPPKK